MGINLYKETTKQVDENGNITEVSVERTNRVIRNDEPDYIKIYTRIWCEFNLIPEAYRELFLRLATQMSYACTTALHGGQLVHTGYPLKEEIKTALKWKDAMYYKGLKVLTECNAIRKITRGVYQINPSYAGRGEWKYNPRLQRGGIEDIVVKFSFKDKTVDTSIVWADDGEENPLNAMYRQIVDAQASDQAVLKEITIIEPQKITANASSEDQTRLKV